MPLRASAVASLDLFGEADTRRQARQGAFVDNMKLPVHRWYRYSAGFSAEWVESVLDEAGGAVAQVLDPFAGSGTSLIAAQQCGVESVGFEAQSFVARAARAKLAWTASPTRFRDEALAVLEAARSIRPPEQPARPPLLARCFTPEALTDLEALKHAYEWSRIADDDVRRLVWLAITAILRETSHVGTAQWQYVLPQKSKARTRAPFDAFAAKVLEMSGDMQAADRARSVGATLFEHDARTLCPALGRGAVDMVVTSPPYPNNYDYADATRLEMSFWGEIDGWGDLHRAVRWRLLTSCSQHSAAERMDLETLLESPELQPILAGLSQVCRALAAEREVKPGKKTYHTMVAAYFRDLSQVWSTLRHHLKAGGTAVFVVGDSAPYGVHVPVERWLGELALAAGFRSWRFEKLRDRNIKWKNRKHRVPLHEGIMRVQG